MLNVLIRKTSGVYTWDKRVIVELFDCLIKEIPKCLMNSQILQNISILEQKLVTDDVDELDRKTLILKKGRKM